MNTMSEKERQLIPEAINTILQLPPEMQERLIWLGKGMLLAGAKHGREGQTSN